MRIQFCGATTGVTGSCHLIRTENHNVLLDCGQFQGGKAQEAMNRDEFPFDPKEVECLILSHAHISYAADSDKAAIAHIASGVSGKPEENQPSTPQAINTSGPAQTTAGKF